MADLVHGSLARQLDGGIRQVAHDGFHVAADIADLGKFGGFYLDERCIGQPCQPSCNLGLADTGRADHEDVLRGDFSTQWIIHLHAAPAIAQGNGDGALGGILADDVLVQFLDNFSGGHFRHVGVK